MVHGGGHRHHHSSSSSSRGHRQTTSNVTTTPPTAPSRTTLAAVAAAPSTRNHHRASGATRNTTTTTNQARRATPVVTISSDRRPPRTVIPRSASSTTPATTTRGGHEESSRGTRHASPIHTTTSSHSRQTGRNAIPRPTTVVPQRQSATPPPRNTSQTSTSRGHGSGSHARPTNVWTTITDNSNVRGSSTSSSSQGRNVRTTTLGHASGSHHRVETHTRTTRATNSTRTSQQHNNTGTIGTHTSSSSSRRDDGISHGSGNHGSSSSRVDPPTHHPYHRTAVSHEGRRARHAYGQQRRHNSNSSVTTNTWWTRSPPRRHPHRSTTIIEESSDREAAWYCSFCWRLSLGLGMGLGLTLVLVAAVVVVGPIAAVASALVLGGFSCCYCNSHNRPLCQVGALSCCTTTSTARTNSCQTMQWVLPTGLIASCLLGLSLISISHVEMNHPVSGAGEMVYDKSVFTMWAGETLHVDLPALVRKVEVTVVQPPSSASPLVSAAVFALPSACPPRTGPPVVISQDMELDMAGKDFQYDYFVLGPGSTIDAAFTQLVGKTYIYLLQGQDTLRDIQTGDNIDPMHWEDIALVKRFIDAQQGPSTDSLYYQVRSSQDDVYILVYDNGSTVRDSSLDVALDVVMTTYNLNGKVPQCDNLHWWGRYGDKCVVPLSRSQRNGCFILEAFSSGNDSDKQEQDAENQSGDPVISLQIRTFRNWKRIGLWTALPLALSFLFIACQYVCQGRYDDSNTSAIAEPLLADNGDEQERPPPTAPDFVADPSPLPSAPPMDQDPSHLGDIAASVIVIPPENVEPVPSK